MTPDDWAKLPDISQTFDYVLESKKGGLRGAPAFMFVKIDNDTGYMYVAEAYQNKKYGDRLQLRTFYKDRPSSILSELAQKAKKPEAVSLVAGGNPSRPKQENLSNKSRTTSDTLNIDQNTPAVESKPSGDQSDAKILNAAIASQEGFGKEWENAYEQVQLPDTTTEWVDAIKTAFGKRVVFVRPTSEQTEGLLNGVRTNANPDAIYIATDSDRGFVHVAGHELYHDIQARRPDLHEYLSENLNNYAQNVAEYNQRLNRVSRQDEKGVTMDGLAAEMLADFTGDALADPKFLQQLADDNPSKFKQLLSAIRNYLRKVVNTLKRAPHDNESSRYITDVEAMREHLRVALDAFTKGKTLQSSSPQKGGTPTPVDFMTAWHGSPHDHNKFSTEQIGTGEGNQAYGWGMYFSGDKNVAEYYKNKLSGRVKVGDVLLDGKPFDLIAKSNHPGQMAMGAVDQVAKDQIDLRDSTTESILDNVGGFLVEKRDFFKNDKASWGRAIKWFDKYRGRIDVQKDVPGKLYQVDLKPAEDEYLLWDKPLSDQSEKVKVALNNLSTPAKRDIHLIKDSYGTEATGQNLYDKVLMDEQASAGTPQSEASKNISEYLKSLGIRGVKYLDGNSRGRGTGEFNYVIFDDADVSIDAKFMTAWHGSPYDHDKFSTEQIGTGEGNQAYGWGLYFAGNKEVAEYYKDTLTHHDMDFEYWLDEQVDEESDTYDGLDYRIEDLASYIYNGYSPSKLTEYIANEYMDDPAAKRHLLKWVDLAKENGFKEGKLYQVDLKPAEDEYLLWDKELSDQSERVKNILKENWDKLQAKHVFDRYTFDEVMGFAANGESMYGGLRTELRGQKEASMFLKDLGIPGIKFLDGNSRMKGEGGYNYVIFDDADVSIDVKFMTAWRDTNKNTVEGAISQNQEDIDPSLEVNFSRQGFHAKKGDRIKSQKHHAGIIGSIGRGLSKAKESGVSWKTFKDNVRPALLNLLSGKQLTELYDKAFKGRIKSYTDLVDAMREEKSKIVNRADALEKQWRAHKQTETIGEVLLDGTFHQVDPLKEFGEHNHILSKREKLSRLESMPLTAATETEASMLREALTELEDAHSLLVDKYDSLDGKAKKIYREVRRSYTDSLVEYKNALYGRITQSEMSGKAKNAARLQVEAMFTEMAQLEAYFPLKRFGQHILLADIDGERHVMKFETADRAEAEKIRLVKEGHIAERYTETEYLASDSTVTPAFMTDVENLLEENGIMDQGMRDSLNQLYLNYLPESSARKSFMHRSYVKGYSKDALRSFSHSMFHGAHHMAKVKFAEKLQTEINRMDQMTNRYVWNVYAGDDRLDPIGNYNTEVEAREARVSMLERMPEAEFTIERKENPDLMSDMDDPASMGMVVNHMRTRHEVLMNPKGAQWVNALSGYGFVMHLGVTPAAAMVNMSQTAMVALPQMAARHGWGKASKALGRYTRDFVGKGLDTVDGIETDEYMTDARKQELANILEARKETKVFDKTMSSLMTKQKINNRQRAALMHLYETGTLDMSQNSDLSMVAHNDTSVRQGGQLKGKKLLEVAGYLFHNVEVFNREVTGLAAYDLAFEDAVKNGMSEQEAHQAGADYAIEAIDKGHFDYSTENRAMFMKGNVMRVITQFKQYSQNMIFRLFRGLHQSFQGETQVDRDLARRELVGIIGMHAVFAGAAGLPYLTLPAVLDAITAMKDDEDDPFDAEVEFQNYLTDKLGQKNAEMVMYGVLRGVPILESADISSRISINGLAIRDSNRDSEGAHERMEVFKNLLGPQSALLITNPMDSWDHWQDGNWQKAAESMSPKFMKDISKAIRNMTEGEISKSGITQMEPEAFDTLDTVVQMIGFNPSKKSNMYEGRNAVYNVEQRLKNRRRSLKNAWVRAKTRGETEQLHETEAEIERFNEHNPEKGMRITRKSLRRSLKAKRRRQEQTKFGIHTTKNTNYLLDHARFARVE
jgi:hypothetical protein